MCQNEVYDYYIPFLKYIVAILVVSILTDDLLSRDGFPSFMPF